MKVTAYVVLILACASSALHAQTGDLNGDGVVDFTDFLAFARNYGKVGEIGAGCGSLAGDFDCNNKVDFTDFLRFAANYGKTDSGGEGNTQAADFLIIGKGQMDGRL